MEYWTIALFGTNTYHSTDINSEADLSVLGTTDPMTDVDWMKIKVTGMKKKDIKVDGMKQSVGLITRNPTGSYTEYNPDLVPFIFPTDLKAKDDLFRLLDYDYIWIYKGDYDFTSDNWNLHATGKAVCVASIGDNEDDYDNGVKPTSILFRKVKPNPRPL